MKAIQIKEFGGPEVLEHTELPDPEPQNGEVIVDVSRAGVNFADTHVTRNDYLAEQTLPMVPGGEIAGATADGKRVAALVAGGGYAEKVAVPAGWLVPVPEGVSDDQAAGLLLQGLTAHALVHKCAQLSDGETVVVEAAAGGTG
ncbi:MAG: quinone oxidoreductase family protein, partial [Solirubrobacterales bacterium]